MLSLLTAAACLPCHASIVESYSQTGMAKSFYRLTEQQRIEDFQRNNQFLHEASQSRFEMTVRNGRFYMKRHSGPYTMEKEIHYVLGSGNHARSYVHITPKGRLLALPVSWYARDGGGYWQMAPGFDRPDHPHFRRRIGYDCFFCHNTYPNLPANADVADPVYLEPLPQGIDCTRCHGPAEEHLSKPRKGNILNPRGLSQTRKLELCLQCHLETTSQALPFAVRRFGRGIFSYNPREPLSNYMIHFDHEDKPPWNEKFEVVSAPYRMMQSKCFQRSTGKMTCLTCHNPHQRSRADDHACRDCHGAAHQCTAAAKQNCVSCHMAKRHPEDAPLTQFTDHKIARRPDISPGRALPEYKGRVRIYWPSSGVPPIYESIVNPRDWPRWMKQPPSEAEALQALQQYETAVQKAPNLSGAWRALVLQKFPDLAWMRTALIQRPRDPFLLTVYGEALRRDGQLDAAEKILRQAIAEDPDQFEPYINLGVLLAGRARASEAAAMFQSALAIDPLNQAAISNLKLLERR